MSYLSPKKGRGFTLIELLVVISIMSFISTLAYTSLNSARVKARDSARLAQTREVAKALDMYYDANGHYPEHAPTTADDNIPLVWGAMISDLSAANLIKATFSKVDFENDGWLSYLVKKAYAAFQVYDYHKCSIQDPLYKIGNDFPNSYGYTSATGQSYIIRVRLENPDNPAFQSSLTETFGVIVCGKSVGYYCLGGGN